MSGNVEIVRQYLDHIGDHVLEDAVACLAPDFEIEFAGAGFRLSRTQAATALEWDVGANGRIEWDVVDESPLTVTIQGVEGNDFLDLLGVGSLEFRAVFTISPAGLISHQLHDVSWGAVSLPGAMQPLISWASEHEAQELAEIYPDGEMAYSGPMAVRWVRLAQKWRGGTSSKS